MTAREYFESVRGYVVEVAKMDDELAVLAAACGPRAMSSDATGGGSSRGGPTPEDRLVDAEIELDRAKRALHTELHRACRVLYGASGRGGVARERGYAAADSIHGYYLQAMKWREVADELVRPESKDGAHWCRNAANAAFRCIDRIGMARIANS